MYTKNRLTSTFTLRSLLGNLDFTLLFAVLTLGIISIFAQYSSSGGEFDYHSRSHAIRFFVFFLVFLSDEYTNGRTTHFFTRKL